MVCCEFTEKTPQTKDTRESSRMLDSYFNPFAEHRCQNCSECKPSNPTCRESMNACSDMEDTESRMTGLPSPTSPWDAGIYYSLYMIFISIP